MNVLPKNLLPKREEGQGLVEYALLLVLVAIVVIAILSMMGTKVSGILSEIVGYLGGLGAPSGYDYTINSFTVTRTDIPPVPPNIPARCKHAGTASISISPAAESDLNIGGSVSGTASVGISGNISQGGSGTTLSGSTTKDGACPTSGSYSLTVGNDSSTYTY